MKRIKYALSSLQAHASVVPQNGGGYCPTIGCTDLSLPRVIEYDER
jgi:hypothetical protein